MSEEAIIPLVGGTSSLIDTMRLFDDYIERVITEFYVKCNQSSETSKDKKLIHDECSTIIGG